AVARSPAWSFPSYPPGLWWTGTGDRALRCHLACETDGRTAAYRGNQSSPCIPHTAVAHPTGAASSQRRADVSPLRILYLCADPGIPVLGFKGASTHVRSLVSALIEAGHTVTVVCTKRGEGNPLATELVEVAPDAEARQLGQL